MKENAKSTTKQGNEANTMLYSVGDNVEVIAKIDYQGRIGRIISITEEKPHNIRVDFIDTWCNYSANEIKLQPS